MNKKGQGALEYLLLIGGAVLVASIVIALITGTTSGVADIKKQAACASKITCRECVSDIVNACAASYSDGTFTKAAAGAACSTTKTYSYCRTTLDTSGNTIPGFT